MACFITGYKGENKSIAYLSPTVRYCNAVIIGQQLFWAQYTDAIRGMGKKNLHHTCTTATSFNAVLMRKPSFILLIGADIINLSDPDSQMQQICTVFMFLEKCLSCFSTMTAFSSN